MPSNKPENLNEGVPDHKGLDETGKAEFARTLAEPKATKVGNLKDVQEFFGEDGKGSK